jgi:cyanophycinase
MGGGLRQDAAFRWLCERANGGDFLVLSTRDDAYVNKINGEIKAECPLNSVATISFFSREDSTDPEVVRVIDHAESIYLAGGDQSD